VEYFGRDAAKPTTATPFQFDDYYNVTITPSGSSIPTERAKDGSNNVYAIRSVNDESIAFDCTARSNVRIFRPYQYRSNLKSNRFLRSYPGGYLGGNDNGDEIDPPYISGGTCTKIE
jgi:hypothetical protein